MDYHQNTPGFSKFGHFKSVEVEGFAPAFQSVSACGHFRFLAHTTRFNEHQDVADIFITLEEVRDGSKRTLGTLRDAIRICDTFSMPGVARHRATNTYLIAFIDSFHPDLNFPVGLCTAIHRNEWGNVVRSFPYWSKVC